MKTQFKFFGMALALFVMSNNASAEIVSAGEPPEVRVETSPEYIFPDIYQRQLAYRNQRLALVRDIEARQQNFVDPSIQAHRQYLKDLQRLHDSMDVSEF